MRAKIVLALVFAFALGIFVFLAATASVAFAQNDTNRSNDTSNATTAPGPFTLGAQQISELAASAGVTPDSALYFLDSMWDKMKLWMASWGGPEAFANASLSVLRETRAEEILMALRNNTAAMATAQSRFEDVKSQTLNAVSQLRNETTRAVILSEVAAVAQDKVSWLSATLQSVSQEARPKVSEALSTANATLQDVKSRLSTLLISLPKRFSVCIPQPVADFIISNSGGRCEAGNGTCPLTIENIGQKPVLTEVVCGTSATPPPAASAP